MSALLAPDVSQIERAIDALLERSPGARVLGLRSPTHRNWPDVLERRGQRFRLAWCMSELEVCERLDEADDSLGIVVLTPLDPASLGYDVAARLPRGRLEQSDRWTALRNAFRARDVDPRLRTHRWLADLLLERPRIAGYPPATGSMLDLETAWRAVLEHLLGLPEGRTDVSALLAWTLDPAGLERFGRLPEEARRAVAERLTWSGGAAAGLVFGAAGVGRGTDALPLGLVCGVVFGEAEPGPMLREAAVRLEPMVGGTRLSPDAARSLADAARRELGRLASADPATARALQTRATALLAEVSADGAAALSAALDVGLDARMTDAALSLAAAVTSGKRDDAILAWDRMLFAAAHDRAADQTARLDRLKMAARLAGWLTISRPEPPQGLTMAAAGYAGKGAFVDRARHALRSGDAIPEIAAAYSKVREAAAARREEENRAFAVVLRAWIAAGAPGVDPLPVDKLLEKVVGPLARGGPVLMIVFDGLSLAVWQDLMQTVLRMGWMEFWPSGRTTPPVAAAVLPTITQVSRTSLLCGTLTRGDQATERAGFAVHPALVAASGARLKPRLFHKAELGPGPELETAVRDAIADPHHRVVGVVHNAVDAQLSGSDQIELIWTAEGMRQLVSILRVARDAGRIVVVTGDHGHVVDDGTPSMPDWPAERWRAAGPAGEGELVFSGSRVIPPEGGHSVVAAWSERLRSAARRSGYHGGASPQEVLVPVAVLGTGQPPSGWYLAPPAEPAWWRGATEVGLNIQSVMADPPAIVAARGPSADPRQPELFSSLQPLAEHPAAGGGAVPPEWIPRLLATEAYATQRRLAGRGAPGDDQVRTILHALSARGGRLSQGGLAQALSAPLLRVGGLVNAARRVLNLDQAQILAINGDEITLDERLLRVQFGLGGDA